MYEREQPSNPSHLLNSRLLCPSRAGYRLIVAVVCGVSSTNDQLLVELLCSPPLLVYSSGDGVAMRFSNLSSPRARCKSTIEAE